MRSIPFTLLLLLLTAGLALTALMRLSEGSLDRLFGPPATAVGENPSLRMGTSEGWMQLAPTSPARRERATSARTRSASR